jgi:predicted glycosyltransferase
LAGQRDLHCADITLARTNLLAGGDDLMLPPPIASAQDGVRVLHYCHDSYGLGHLRRTIALASHLRQRIGSVTQLIVSGAAHTDGWALPAGADWVKLPAVVKSGPGRYRPRSLECSFDTTLELRKELLLASARRFGPDVMVVDHVPAGLDGEALPALRHAAAAGTKLLLGLRDVIDDPTLVQRDWRKSGVHALLDGLYDRIVVYGDPRIYDVVRQYDFSPSAAVKSQYVGYLRAAASASSIRTRHRLGIDTDRLVVVSAGGGGDGYGLIEATLRSLRDDPPPRTTALVVTGPLMPEAERAALERLGSTCRGHVRLVDAVADLSDMIAAADAVVSMGGYNTVREILSHRKRALVVPRVQPRKEQLIRAEALAERGLVRLLHPADLTAERLTE